jgi:hypothetical protein
MTKRGRHKAKYNLRGQKFGRWLVLEHHSGDIVIKSYWLYKCDCGTVRPVAEHSLVRGKSLSCGCLSNHHPRPQATCHPDRPHWARGLCNQCWRAWYCQNRRDRTEHLAKRAITERRERIIRKGLTPQEYAILLKQQGGLCAICRRPPGIRRLAIDTDHSNRAVRGLLCTSCNNAIGVLGDTANSVHRAVKYLERYENTRS